MAEISTNLQSPVRHVEGTVVYTIQTNNNNYRSKEFTADDKLVSVTLEGLGATDKFFGFGITKKCNVKIMYEDLSFGYSEEEIKARMVQVKFGKVESEWGVSYEYTSPQYDVTEIHKDENTNQLSITGYDLVYTRGNKYILNDLDLPTAQVPSLDENGNQITDESGNVIYNTVYDFSFDTLWRRISAAIIYGLPAADYSSNSYITVKAEGFEFPTNTLESINLTGEESLREVLDKMAEYFGSIYHFTAGGVQFRRLPAQTEPKLVINKSDYFNLKSGENRRLSTLAHITELGENISTTTGVTGTTQYIRSNPFFDLLEPSEVSERLIYLKGFLGNFTVAQFDLQWRGNYNLKCGDRIAIETKDGSYITSYVIDTKLEYNGALTGKMQWEYQENEGENATNPATIGEAINQTYAKVDKVNKQVDIVASDIQANKEEIGAIRVNTDNISLSVEKIEKSLTDSTESINGQIEEIQKKVELGITAEDVTINVKETLKSGVEEVTTETGFTFNNEGLTIDKSDSEMKTQITEDGMVVYKNEQAMLTANNTGVYAQNLHATTYLIVGGTSRFEDYTKDGEARTGCFWLGGN